MKLHILCLALSTFVSINANDETSSNSGASRSEGSREYNVRLRMAHFVELKKHELERILNRKAVIYARIVEENGEEYLAVDELWKNLLCDKNQTRVPRKFFYTCKGPARNLSLFEYAQITRAIAKSTPQNPSESDCIII
jgi:hypothetical protein